MVRIVEYRGWKIKVYKHVHFPPYKDWNASCYRQTGNKLYMLNCEADSEEHAIDIAKNKIDNYVS